MIMLKIVTLFVCLITGTVSFAQTWSNPHRIENEWDLYAVGDPYILKYNGIFYLYCSTRDSETGVKVWSSKDIQSWKYEGLCTTEPITHGAYAPEVIHWGGHFYMYTSPAGRGHYVLKSKSPTGPFEVVTGNLGHSIDGSVFKEDDGSIYFYHSGDDGIHAHKMNSPTSFGADIVLNSTRMHGWTEGPCVVKRNGVYYMIYTGNHVISKGYRIDLATSEESPVSGFIPDNNQNPVILNAEGDHVGLGHGSIFRGPNLDEYFITYHNLAGDFGVGPFRNLNFDRVSFNDKRMLVHGPTNTDQQVPALPDFTVYFDREDDITLWETDNEANWVFDAGALRFQDEASNKGVAFASFLPEADYIAECNVKEQNNNPLEAGLIFNFTDWNNYALATLNNASNTLKVVVVENGSETVNEEAGLVGVEDYSIWHSIRVEIHQQNVVVFVDDMEKISFDTGLETGKIGYYSESSQAVFGFMGIGNQINGSTSFDAAKPIPGKFAAVQYTNEGPGSSFHVSNVSSNTYRYDSAQLSENDLGGYSVDLQTGDWFKYKAMVEKNSAYTVGLTYLTSNSECVVRLTQNDASEGETFTLTATNHKTLLVPVGEITLNQGIQEIKVEVVSGELSLYALEFIEFESVSERSDQFEKNFSYHWKYKDGDWSLYKGAARGENTSKRFMGKDTWTNYSVVADVKCLSGTNGGLVFRATNPALGGAGNDAAMGTDFFQGYYVMLGTNGVFLGKHNYDYTLLEKGPGSYRNNEWYRLAVTVQGATIKVYVDDMETPLIEYTDEDPFLSGKAGIRTHRSTVLFDNFHITTEPLSNPTGKTESKLNQPTIYPNPTQGEVFISHDGNLNKAEVFNVFGQKVVEKDFNAASTSLSLFSQPSGTYVLRLFTNASAVLDYKILKF